MDDSFAIGSTIVIMTNAPCRLFVYLARDAPLGLVLRRGPSAWTRLSLWHIDQDTFEHGQWFRGRIYERRSDISCDGSLFLYFARKDGHRSSDMEQVDSWLAISRPPWFTALALWPVGGTYAFGGYFVTSTSIFVGGIDAPQVGQLPFWLTSRMDIPHVDCTRNWTEEAVYFRRLLRDGWTQAEGSIDGTTWQRVDPSGKLTLRMTHKSSSDYQTFGGPHIVEYSILASGSGTIDLGRASWADWDQWGRLLLAKNGKLLQWQLPGEMRVIADLNAQRPEATPAPSWASNWPRRPMHPR